MVKKHFFAPTTDNIPEPRPTTSFLDKQTIPPASTNSSKAGMKKRKRDHPTVVDSVKGDANNKGKDEDASEVVFYSFYDLAKANFKAENVNDCKKMNVVEADY